ncbi:MAG: uroporphyrinogen-III decarboxylase-like protein [Anaerolineae bacterium]|nr:uroporphyrinogen-III decarboxylase-like protein [Anaerolineae bacterium]
MPRETMTPRERWEAVLTRQTPDRVPMDYWATGEMNEKLTRSLGCADLDEALSRLHVDRPLTVGPDYVGPTIPEGYDVFGLQYKQIDYGTGAYDECINAPLAQYDSVDAIERSYRWPDPDWYDYRSIPQQVAGHEHRPIRGGGSEPLLIYKKLRGEAQAFMDLVEHPEMVHYCLDKLFELAYQNTLRIYEQIPGQVMISYVAEDMGSQHGLMIAPEQIRTFLLPRMQRMIDLAHQTGAFVFHHNDGGIRAILPDMIEAGIDVLNPIQWRCVGMDRQALKRDFGDRLVFHGAVDNQYTLPFGSVQEVRQEVEDNLRILGAGGGYILAPCHNIQANTPVENVLAMYETGYALGWT